MGGCEGDNGYQSVGGVQRTGRVFEKQNNLADYMYICMYINCKY